VADFQLNQLPATNPYFALTPGDQATGPGWQPVSRLLADTPKAATRLDAAIHNVAARLGTRTRWVAASILYQGWASRLTSIYAGALSVGSTVPDLAAERLRYRLAPTGPVELAAHPLIGLDPDHAWRRIIDDHLHPLADAVRRQAQIGRRLLDGNIASSMAGSLTTLARTGQAPLATLIDRPWAQPEDLAPYGEWTVSAEGPRYVRNTCCGYEQLSEGWRCGDCSLARERLRS
jgi:ferric iron reductase protein FhuF